MIRIDDWSLEDLGCGCFIARRTERDDAPSLLVTMLVDGDGREFFPAHPLTVAQAEEVFLLSLLISELQRKQIA